MDYAEQTEQSHDNKSDSENKSDDGGNPFFAYAKVEAPHSILIVNTKGSKRFAKE